MEMKLKRAHVTMQGPLPPGALPENDVGTPCSISGGTTFLQPSNPHF